MVKPGGTGMPRLVISARPAPLPPRRFLISALPSALPSPKKYTNFCAIIPPLPEIELPEIGDAEEEIVDAAEQCQPVSLHALVLVHDEDLVEEGIHRRLELGQDAQRLVVFACRGPGRRAGANGLVSVEKRFLLRLLE